MEMKRMRRTRRETMADMESIRDLTRRDMDFQYLGGGHKGYFILGHSSLSTCVSFYFCLAFGLLLGYH